LDTARRLNMDKENLFKQFLKTQSMKLHGKDVSGNKEFEEDLRTPCCPNKPRPRSQYQWSYRRVFHAGAGDRCEGALGAPPLNGLFGCWKCCP
jgi:hypothetical protein